MELKYYICVKSLSSYFFVCGKKKIKYKIMIIDYIVIVYMLV